MTVKKRMKMNATNEYVTKSDLKAELACLEMGIKTELRSEIQGLGTELRSDMQEMKTDLRTEMYAIRSELRSDMQDLAALVEERSEDTKRHMGALVEHVLHEFKGVVEVLGDLPAAVADHRQRLEVVETDVSDLKALAGFRK